MQTLVLLFGSRFVSAGIVGVLVSMVASLYYVDLAGLQTPDQVMSMRPDAPGSAKALLAEHPECRVDGKISGPVSAVIARQGPNDPYLYASSVRHTHEALFIHALEQAIQGKDRGLDAVLALCPDPAPTTRKG